MPASTHVLTFPGAINKRGFWLYVWRIETAQASKGVVLYVGCTGDTGSVNASSPIARMGQHLGTNPKENALRRHLEECGIDPELCTDFKMVAYGPLFPEEKERSKHMRRWSTVAALEKKLADTLRSAEYDVLNKVNWKQPLDQKLWHEVREAFAIHFCKLVNA